MLAELASSRVARIAEIILEIATKKTLSESIIEKEREIVLERSAALGNLMHGYQETALCTALDDLPPQVRMIDLQHQVRTLLPPRVHHLVLKRVV